MFDEVLRAFQSLNESYSLSIYGPIKEHKYRNSPSFQEVYKGIVPKEAMPAILMEHDLLVLPTHFTGEGYPGSIIEAYAVGMPVITTRWKAIPEIVEQGKTGLLISIKSHLELLSAIQHFDESNYLAFSKKCEAEVFK